MRTDLLHEHFISRNRVYDEFLVTNMDKIGRLTVRWHFKYSIKYVEASRSDVEALVTQVESLFHTGSLSVI